MAWEQVGSGGLLDATELGYYEETFIPEGQRGLLQLDLRMPIPQSIVSQLQSQLRDRGVTEAQVSTGSPVLNISWRHGFPFLAVIVAIVLGLVILAVLITGWRLFKEVVPAGWQPLIGGLGLALLAILGIVLLTRRR